jgi:hypothetical protein
MALYDMLRMLVSSEFASEEEDSRDSVLRQLMVKIRNELMLALSTSADNTDLHDLEENEMDDVECSDCDASQSQSQRRALYKWLATQNHKIDEMIEKNETLKVKSEQKCERVPGRYNISEPITCDASAPKVTIRCQQVPHMPRPNKRNHSK